LKLVQLKHLVRPAEILLLFGIKETVKWHVIARRLLLLLLPIVKRDVVFSGGDWVTVVRGRFQSLCRRIFRGFIALPFSLLLLGLVGRSAASFLVFAGHGVLAEDIEELVGLRRCDFEGFFFWEISSGPSVLRGLLSVCFVCIQIAYSTN
jgi:hypothetical protein